MTGEMSIDVVSFGLLAIVVLVLIGRGLATRSGILELPFLAAAVTGGWFMPQAYGLLGEATLPPGGYALTMIYTAACLCALALGWGKVAGVGSAKFQGYSEQKLMFAAIVLSVLGFAAYTQIFQVDIERTETGLSTGIVTVLFFFSKLQYFGLAIAITLLMRRFSWLALAVVLFDLNTILSFVLFGGRRGPAVFVALILATSLWFGRRIIVPRPALIAGFVAGALLINGISSYRQAVFELGRIPSLSEVLELDLVEASIGLGDNFEVRNAVHYIAAAFESSNYDFGAQYWNYFIFSYVPGQFVGAETKAALIVSTDDNALLLYRYVRQIGTTVTGFTDSFTSFSFLGVAVFYGIGALMRRWWNEALIGVRGQLLYASTLASALEGITHSTQWYFVFALQAVLFIVPALVWARSGEADRPNMSKAGAKRGSRLGGQPSPVAGNER
jgi:hypothetical protein